MNPSPEVSIPKFAPRPFLLWLGAGVLALNLFVLLMAGVSLQRSWRNHQDRAVASVQNLAQVLDRTVADTFRKADLAVLAIKDEAERSAGDFRKGRPDLDAFIRRQHERAPELLALRISDAQGVIRRGSGPGVGAYANVADREHFIRLREDPKAGPVISKPIVGRLTGTWVIILARRLDHPDGSFAGMAHAVIALDQFNQVFSALDVGPRGSVALRDLDLGLVARHPEPLSAGTAIGQRNVSQEYLAFAQSGSNAIVYRTRTPFDRIQRTFAVRRVSGQPFYIAVGLAERDYLGPWRMEVLQECLEAVLFACLTLVAAWLLRRAWLRQQAAHEQLEALLAEVKTLGGMLPICSHCKKIRDDRGYWNQIEAYLNEHTDAEFTHGICPDCAKEVFPNSGKHTAL
jgi:hypothetical protein